jgi:hypothetical protein
LVLGINSATKTRRIGVFFFQHSNTPSLQYSRAETFISFWQPNNYLFIGYNSETYYLLVQLGGMTRTSFRNCADNILAV